MYVLIEWLVTQIGVRGTYRSQHKQPPLSFFSLAIMNLCNLPLMDIAYPILGNVFYLAILKTFWPKYGAEKRRTGSMFKGLVILHNTALAVFSGYIFYKTAPHLITQLQQYDSFEDFVVSGYRGKEWEYFEPYAWAFYLSKFYEYADTFIHLYKGNPPITLQVVHHIGAVLTMWVITLAKQPGTW